MGLTAPGNDWGYFTKRKKILATMSQIENNIDNLTEKRELVQLKLRYIRCPIPNCNRINGAISIDTKGVQQFICKNSKCRHEFYAVDGKVVDNFDKSLIVVL